MDLRAVAVTSCADLELQLRLGPAMTWIHPGVEMEVIMYACFDHMEMEAVEITLVIVFPQMWHCEGEGLGSARKEKERDREKCTLIDK